MMKSCSRRGNAQLPGPGLAEVAEIPFESYGQSVALAMDAAGAANVLAGHGSFLLKPNLVNGSPPPVTTAPQLCRAVIDYIHARIPHARIIIAEGCGDPHMETGAVFGMLGYRELAEQTGAELLDLNQAPVVERKTPDHEVFPTMHLPEAAFSHCLISLPVLKRHSYAGITGTLKNMMGFAPPDHYSGRGGYWKKSVFHLQMHESLRDLNRHILPHFTIMDATVGMVEYHLGGRAEPYGLLLASADAYALDCRAAELLHIAPETIGHLHRTREYMGS